MQSKGQSQKLCLHLPKEIGIITSKNIKSFLVVCIGKEHNSKTEQPNPKTQELSGPASVKF